MKHLSFVVWRALDYYFSHRGFNIYFLILDVAYNTPPDFKEQKAKYKKTSSKSCDVPSF